MRVGLTGGIGSGKSEVARRLAARGAVVVDYDVLAREAVAPGTPGAAAVLAAFGTLDRERLAARVFADPDARARLNAIVHPLVAVAAARAASAGGAVVVHDVPLLVENGLAPSFDAVVVVEAPLAARLERLARRGMTEAEARARMAAQADDAARRAVATHVVVNDGDLPGLDARVAEVWRALAAAADIST